LTVIDYMVAGVELPDIIDLREDGLSTGMVKSLCKAIFQ